MAYDPKDPADVKIVTDAVAKREAELTAEHETEIEGLRTAKEKLLKEKKDLQKGNGGADTSELEGKIETLEAQVKAAEKQTKRLQTERDAFETLSKTEAGFAEKLLKETRLTEALTGAKVASEFLPAVTKLLMDDVTIKQEGDARRAYVGDKSLEDFVKAWSQGDQGKHYVTAPKNQGGGSEGGGAADPAKQRTRTVFDAMGATEKVAFMKDGGSVIDE